MSTFRNPVGPQPNRVYWRRRLVVLLGLAAVIVVVVLIVVRPGAGSPTPEPTGTSTNGTDPQPTPGATSTNPADAVACDPARVTLEPATDASGYDPGVNPVLSFTLKSTMTVPCSLEAGSDVQEFRVTSGTELIWSSRDCQTDPVAARALLQPGVPFAGPTLAWDRTRSSPETCGVPRDPVTAEGASYHLQVIVGDLTGEDTKQFLLY